ncbi:MAG: NAD(P)/FAD-dependent oxidoreductase [Proteobacteria bacterium]|nr:NAD(P)/FAD-dependent oxidoreductase [Pseudomonadota bacterium]
MTRTDQKSDFDIIIVGAGFAGLYMLHRAHEMGLSARVFEAGDNVGGTWYWNRYPGARCDAESLAYSFSFDSDLEQEWQWTERYATQAEILAYAEHVADRFDLRRHISFESTVDGARYDDSTNLWSVTVDTGEVASAPFLIMATGCLSVPLVPDIEGLENYKGKRYQASLWPHESVDFSNQTIGVIGTGSSAIQAIPVIAQQAEHLTVFQRTPNFSVPAVNASLDDSWVGAFKKNYREHRRFHKLGLSSGFGDLEIEARERQPDAMTAEGLSDAEFDAMIEARWEQGGAYILGTIADTLANETTNARFADFVHRKIRDIVDDPATADALCPTSHPIGTKRICVDTDYYATYNRPNVDLVNLREEPIIRITETGIQLPKRHVAFDTLVLATGFDAMTGALLKMNIQGSNGQKLKDKWAEGPRTYLGLMMAGFPNLFTITGPGSPSVLSNMLVSIEQHVDFIISLITHMRDKNSSRIETSLQAEDQWVNHVNDIANATLFPKGGSWYLGANIPGKPRVFMPYAAGVGVYREVCDEVAADNYRGFILS